MASYEETLVNITLDAHPDIVVDTSNPYNRVGNTPPEGASAVSGFQYRFVQVSGPHQCNLFTGTGVCVGVLQNKPQVEEEAATVAVLGISLVEAGGAIEAGDTVGADGSGRATSGGNLGIAIFGADAPNEGESGELIPVLLRLRAGA